MKKISILLILLNVTLLAQQNDNDLIFDMESSNQIVFYRWKYKIGDNPEYAKTNYEDSNWSVIGKVSKPEEIDQICWYRKTVLLKGDRDEFDFLSLYIMNPATAYEFYWDGLLIHREGTVASSKFAESPGSINRLIQLRAELTTPGRHVMAMRLSNHHGITPRNEYAIQYLSHFNESLNRNLYLHLFNIGMFLFAAIFSLALFLSGGKHRSYLMFTVFSMLNFLYSFFRFLENSIDMRIIFLDYIYPFYNICGPVSLSVLNLFFILNFDVKRKTIHIGINIVLTILVQIFLPFSFVSLLPVYSIGIVLSAVKRKESGSLIALFGISIYTALYILFFFRIEEYFLFADILFVSSIMLVISRQIRAQNKLYEMSRIRSARLETALLKKNIRPHFLINTLSSILSWIELNPKKAVKQIQALSDEFKMINKISSKKEIPIHQEITLCENHLKLMGYRMDAEYKFIQENIFGEETVPPMIFHTLIENGLTHAFKSGEDGDFKLSCKKNGKEIHYTMQNSGSLLRSNYPKSQDEIIEGMGIKYVKARLEESYPGKWKLSYGLVANTWKTDIYIRK